MDRVLVCIPALNEEQSIGTVLDEIRDTDPRWSMLVIDDGSSDATSLVARRHGAVVVRAPFNLGVGGAMRIGFKYALEHHYDAAVQVDADGQHDAGDIAAMLDALPRTSTPASVIAARFTGEKDYDVSRTRRFAMWTLAKVLSRIAHTQLTDVTSGFRAHNRSAIAFYARNYPIDYLADTVESLLLLARAGGSVSQVPTTMRPRLTGQPSQSAWKSLVYLTRVFVVLGLAVIRRPDPGS